MPVIACKLGFTQQTVGGATYAFNFDPMFGAHVAHVHNLAHAACFLSLDVYQEVEKQGAQQEDANSHAPVARKPRKSKTEPVQEQVKDEA